MSPEIPANWFRELDETDLERWPLLAKALVPTDDRVQKLLRLAADENAPMPEREAAVRAAMRLVNRREK